MKVTFSALAKVSNARVHTRRRTGWATRLDLESTGRPAPAQHLANAAASNPAAPHGLNQAISLTGEGITTGFGLALRHCRIVQRQAAIPTG